MILIGLSGLAWGPTPSLAKIIYVDDDASADGDGVSWVTALTDLQQALSGAASGDEIRVAEGVYKPNGPNDNREASFQLIDGLALKGGYAGSGQVNPDDRNINLYETILSGDLNGDDEPGFINNYENSYHVVTSDRVGPTAVLDGFTITGGMANGAG